MAVVKTHHWQPNSDAIRPAWKTARPFVIIAAVALLFGLFAVAFGWTFSWLKAIFDNSALWSSGGVAHEMPLLIFTTFMVVQAGKLLYVRGHDSATGLRTCQDRQKHPSAQNGGLCH